jgi:hypothetical protein
MVFEFAKVHHPEFIAEYLEKKKNAFGTLMHMNWKIAYKHGMQQKDQ